MKQAFSLKFIAAATVSLVALSASTAFAAEPESCATVRFSDVGWTDITSTTATASVILKGLGYTTDVKVLSVPVTYQSLKNKDIDIFLGNWMPTQENDVRPFLDDKSVESFGPNLVGAKYTLATNAKQGLRILRSGPCWVGNHLLDHRRQLHTVQREMRRAGNRARGHGGLELRTRFQPLHRNASVRGLQRSEGADR